MKILGGRLKHHLGGTAIVCAFALCKRVRNIKTETIIFHISTLGSGKLGEIEIDLMGNMTMLSEEVERLTGVAVVEQRLVVGTALLDRARSSTIKELLELPGFGEAAAIIQTGQGNFVTVPLMVVRDTRQFVPRDECPSPVPVHVQAIRNVFANIRRH